jgi:uncharacterized membrane protein
MSRSRIASLDIARGAVMVLMALDHVRVYAGVPAGGPSPGVFFTRWVTHFCAPAFVFLAGSSAYLYGQRVANRAVLARYLVSRGLLLIALELTVIRLAWTFNFDFAHYALFGVIWMFGVCMILLAVLIWLPSQAIGTLGVTIIALHNLSAALPDATAEAWSGSLFWEFLYFGGVRGPIAILYSIVPWIGVMAAGYAFGAIMLMDDERRRRICFRLGAAAIALFLILRFLDAYGDPRHWRGVTDGPPAVLRFLNTTKYPASLLFLLMTLGPLIAILPALERARGPIGRTLTVFGRVPLFFYLLHIPLIHVLAIIVAKIRNGSVDPWLFMNHPMMVPPAPEGYRWSLPLLYLVYAIAVTLLYVPCRWYADLKGRSNAAWMRYV